MTTQEEEKPFRSNTAYYEYKSQAQRLNEFLKKYPEMSKSKFIRDAIKEKLELEEGDKSDDGSEEET